MRSRARARGPASTRRASVTRTAGRLALAPVVALAAAETALGQENEDCFGCHDIEDLEVERDGRTFSIYVAPERYEESVHGALDCTICHLDLDGVEEWPHAKDLERVDCTGCHDDDDGPIAAYRRSPHGRGEPDAGGASCQDCHGSHGIEPLSERSPSGEPFVGRCAECHGDVAEGTRHGRHLAAGVDCLDCHDGHAVSVGRPADLALATARVNALCTRCHADVLAAEPGEIHAAAFRGRTCLACHDPHGPVRPEAAAVDRACLLCHGEDEGPAPPGTVASSVHGRAGVSCVLCHADLADAELPHDEDLEPARCDACHPAAADGHASGVHAHAVPGGGIAAACKDCHGTHDVLETADARSRVFPRNQPQTCESCHAPVPPAAHPAPGGDRVLRYESSVHGRLLLEDGLLVSATCSSCHGSHEIHDAEEPEAATSRARVPYTCGSCHAGMLEGYLAGVHGSDFASGGADVPVCTDCHSEHAIEDPALEEASVSSGLVAGTCARCHADDELANRYGFDSKALLTWGSSYHGIASGFGETTAANCASCHGHHEILPSSDPRSRVHPANLDATCGSCHEGAGAAFAKVPVHSSIDRETNPIAWYVRTIYAWLVGAVIGAFVLFILIDLFGRLRLRIGWGPPETEAVDPAGWPDEDELVSPHETFLRMRLHARVQHAILIASFLLLVLTGLPVFLHEVPGMRSLVADVEGGYLLRSRLHRIGAVGLIGLSVWHVAVLALSPGGRRWFWSMMLRPRDFVDFAREVMFNLGLMDWIARRRPFRRFFQRFPALRFAERPALGRYGLVEKLEYGAVLWGNVVMILTGTMLWRPDWFLAWLPVWTFDVSRVVHGFEATLAFLAIVIWHMYHVHLRPGAFPMSPAWLTGRIPRDELKHHHPLEYLRVLERRRAERRD